VTFQPAVLDRPASSAYSLAADLLRPESNRPKLEQYWYDPWKFIRDFFFGYRNFPYQKEIINNLLVKKKICVRAPHSAGKTGMVAPLAIWFAITREDMCKARGGDWKVVTTASVERQLTKYLWPEIRKWTRKSSFAWDQLKREPFDRRTELLYTQLKLEYGEAFAVSSDDPANIEGAHADHLLYIIDEAKTVASPTFDAIEGALMGNSEVYCMCISTPGEPNGRFYEIQSRQQGYEDWWCRAISLEECIATGQITREKAEQRARQWGEKSAIYINRVLGNFALDALDGLIPLSWAELAMSRESRQVVEGERNFYFTPPTEKHQVGYIGLANCVACDVGGSGDKSVVATRVGNKCLPLDVFHVDDTMQVSGEVVGAIQRNGQKECTYAVVDVIGIGAGVAHRLRELGYDVEAFNASTAVDFTDHSGELVFLNRRSAAWWGMRELLDPNLEEIRRLNGVSEVILPFDEELLGDLCTPRYKRTSAGKIQVEDKAAIRKRLGRSPDRGDAVVMAFSDRVFAEPEDKIIEYYDPVEISPI